MAVCDLNKDYPLYTDTWYWSARERIKDHLPQWDGFFTFFRWITTDAKWVMSWIKDSFKNLTVEARTEEVKAIQEMLVKAFYSTREWNGFSYNGTLDKALMLKLYETVSNLSHITGLSTETAFTAKIGKNASDINSLTMWKWSMRNWIDMIAEEPVLFEKFLDVLWAWDEKVTPFNIIYNFAPKQIKDAIFKWTYRTEDWKIEQVDLWILFWMRKWTTNGKTIKYLFDKLSDRINERPTAMQQLKQNKWNWLLPWKVLSAMVETKTFRTLSTWAKIAPQFAFAFAAFWFNRASWWALSSLVFGWFFASLNRNIAAKGLSNFEHSELRSLKMDELYSMLEQSSFSKYPWFSNLQWLLVKNATLWDTLRFDIAMFLWRVEDIVATAQSGPQNLAVDAWHWPSYLRYALTSAASTLGITTADEFRLMMSDPELRSKVIGLMEQKMDMYLAANKEASITRAQMPFFYHWMFFFWNRWWNMAKQMVAGPLWLVRRTMLWINKWEFSWDFKDLLLNNAEFKLFASTVVNSILMSTKMERLFWQDDDDDKRTYIEKEKDFYMDFYSNFVTYAQAFFTNGMLRLVTIPTLYALESSKYTDVNWVERPITAVEVMEWYALQALNEMKSSFKLFDLVSKFTRWIKEWSYTSEWREAAIEWIVEQFSEWYANAMADDMAKGLNEWWVIPTSLKDHSSFQFMMWQSANELSDLNFKLSLNWSFSRLIWKFTWSLNEDDHETTKETLWKMFDKTWFGFLRDVAKAVYSWFVDQNIIDDEYHSNFEVKQSMDWLRERQASWVNAQVNFREQNSEVVNYLLLNTMKAVYDVDEKDGNINNFYSSKFYQDEQWNRHLNDTNKKTNIPTWKLDEFGNPTTKWVYDKDLYLQIMDNELATKYSTQYEWIKQSISDAMKIKSNYNASNEAQHKYMELYQDLAPKVKLALAMKAYMNIRIEQAWGDLKLYLWEWKANDYKWIVDVNPLSAETRETIKADTLNFFQRSLRDVDTDLWRKTFLLSNKWDPVTGRFLDANGTALDYNKLGNDYMPAKQLAWIQFYVWLGNAKWQDTSNYNNTLSSMIYNYQSLMEKRWVDKDVAKASGIYKFFEMLPQAHYSEQDKLELTLSHFATDGKAITSLRTNPKIKEFLWEWKTNWMKEQIFSSYQSVNKMEDEMNWLNTDVKNLRDASGKLFWYDNITWYKGSGFWSSGYYSSNRNWYSKAYPNIKPYQAYIKDIIPYYSKESRVNFQSPRTTSYNKQDYNLFRTQSNYAKTQYTLSPRLNKQWGNTVSRNVGRWKGFGLKIERRKSSFAVKSKTWNKRARK
jgi:hypothetical protein